MVGGRHREVPLRSLKGHGRDAPHAERRAAAAHAGRQEAAEDEAAAPRGFKRYRLYRIYTYTYRIYILYIYCIWYIYMII